MVCFGCRLQYHGARRGGGWLFEDFGRAHLLYWWWSDIMLMVWALAAVYTWRIFGQKWSEKRLVEPSVD